MNQSPMKTPFKSGRQSTTTRSPLQSPFKKVAYNNVDSNIKKRPFQEHDSNVVVTNTTPFQKLSHREPPSSVKKVKAANGTGATKLDAIKSIFHTKPPPLPIQKSLYLRFKSMYIVEFSTDGTCVATELIKEAWKRVKNTEVNKVDVENRTTEMKLKLAAALQEEKEWNDYCQSIQSYANVFVPAAHKYLSFLLMDVLPARRDVETAINHIDLILGCKQYGNACPTEFLKKAKERLMERVNELPSVPLYETLYSGSPEDIQEHCLYHKEALERVVLLRGLKHANLREIEALKNQVANLQKAHQEDIEIMSSTLRNDIISWVSHQMVLAPDIDSGAEIRFQRHGVPEGVFLAAFDCQGPNAIISRKEVPCKPVDRKASLVAYDIRLYHDKYEHKLHVSTTYTLQNCYNPAM